MRGEALVSVSASIRLTVSERKGFQGITSVKILDCLIEGGWEMVRDEAITFLPFGDKDDYNWTKKKVGFEFIAEQAKKKEEAKETVGVEIFWRKTEIGMPVLIFSPNDILFSLDINRQKAFENITDVNWYLKRLLPCFEREEIAVTSITFHQY